MGVCKQLSLTLPTWGGKRRGAGRKRLSARPNVPHVARPEHNKNHPVHVTLRLAAGLPNIRGNERFALIRRAFVELKKRDDFRLLQFSVLSNHVHVLAEASNKGALTRALKGLQIRVAKGLNKLLDRKGSVFSDRYHARALSTPREVRAAFAYVLLNARKHAHQRGRSIKSSAFDPCSSAEYFDGWRGRTQTISFTLDSPVVPPSSWLARVGWKRHGFISPAEIPSG